MSAEDVRSVLEAVGEAGAGAEPAPSALEAEVRRITAQVRRRRAARTAGLLAGAAAAVVVGAIGVQALDAPPPPPPAESVTPTPAPTPSPTQEPEETAEPTRTEEPDPEPQPLGGVTEHPALPPASPLLEGMLEASTEDWRLVGYAPRAADGPGAVHYLMAPDAALHEVPTPLELDVIDAAFTGSAVVDWLPGTSLVLVGTTEVVEGATEHSVRDLLTGEVLAELSDPAAGETWSSVRFVRDGTTDVLLTRTGSSWEAVEIETVERVTADGATVWELDGFTAPAPATVTGTGVLLSPDGARLLVNDGSPRVVATSDLAPSGELALPQGVGQCVGELWWGAEHVVLGCGAVGSVEVGIDHAELWLAPVDGGSPTRLTGDAAGVFPSLVVDDRLVASDRGLGDGGRVAFARDGSAVALPQADGVAWFPFGAVAGRVLTPTSGEQPELVALDPFTAGVDVVVPTTTPTAIFVTGQPPR